MIETNGAWAVARRYIGLESLARVSNIDNHSLLAVAV